MPSRMERYYHLNETDENVVSKRTQANKDLYEKIYAEPEYEEVTDVKKINNTGEINLNAIRDLIEEKEKTKEIIKPLKTFIPTSPIALEEEKNYDIRDILNRAKEDKGEDDDGHHTLKNTQYDILKKIDIKNELDLEQEEAALKGLINTITTTSMLNKMADKDLSLHLLDDLKSQSETSIISSTAIHKIVDEVKNEEPEILVMDKSFYTANIPVMENDFVNDIAKKEKPKKGIILKILLYIILVLITSGAILGAILLLK